MTHTGQVVSHRTLSRTAFTVDNFSVQYQNVEELTLEELRRASWITEQWLYDYYQEPPNDFFQDFFILVSQDGQNATDAMNIVTYDAYLSFAEEEEETDKNIQPFEIVAAPFRNAEANAQYARSLKLDMESFREVNLLLDPPVFESIIVPSTRASTQPNNNVQGSLVEDATTGGMSIWAKAIGGTAIGIIAVLHLGVFGMLLARSIKRWSLSKEHMYEEYCSANDENEEESLSIHATPSKSPTSTFDASGAVFLGTIDEDTSYRESNGIPSDDENNATGTDQEIA